MAKSMMLLSLIAIALLLESCTVAYYQVQNGLKTNPSSAPTSGCTVTFSLAVAANPLQLTRSPTYAAERLQKDHQAYALATKEVFTQQGCAAHYADNDAEANFHIYISMSPYWSALPQEWLTGLTFGAIPSWGTRPGEYLFTFEDSILKRSHTYIVDNKSYNHIILFPVFWVTFITSDKIGIYEKALINFLQSV